MRKTATRRGNRPVKKRPVRVVMSAALLAAVVATLYGPASASAADTVCTGTIGATVEDQVVVPDGATCRLEGTTVTQNVIIGVGSTLVALNAEVGGNVVGTNGPAKVRILETNVGGNIQLKKTTGRIVIGDAGCNVDPAVGGNVQLEENSGTIAICQMTIAEDLQLTKNTGPRIGVFRNRIGENLQVADNTGEFLRLGRNRVGFSGSGSMQITKNLTSVSLWRNRITDSLQCSENDPAPIGANNTAASKEGQCATL